MSAHRGKSARRLFKKQRMIAVYREFFSKADNWTRIRAMGLEETAARDWKLARDTVLGSPI